MQKGSICFLVLELLQAFGFPLGVVLFIILRDECEKVLSASLFNST